MLISQSVSQSDSQSPFSRNGSIPGYAESCSVIMTSTYSQENVRAGVDAIRSSPVDLPVRYLAVCQLLRQSAQVSTNEVTLDMMRGVR